MPATITPLPQIAFSKNPIDLVITSDDHIAVPGVNAVANVIFNSAVGIGDALPLLWASADLALVAAAVPDDSGDQFPAGAGDEAHVRAVIAALQQNNYIDTDFELSYALITGLPAMVLTAKNTGVLYNIAPVAGGPISVVTGTAGVNLEYKPNFGHHLEVWLKQPAGDVKIYDNNLQLDYPITGATSKDIADILNPYLTEGSDKPDLSTVTWQACSNSLLEYYVKFAQYYGDSPVVKKITKTDSAFVNLGGLSVQAALGQTMSDYLRPAGSNYNVLCLRQGSKVKMVQTAQPDFLYWINLTGALITIKLRIEVFFSDGSGSQAVTRASQDVAPWQKYYINVGFNAVGVNSILPSGKQCSYYTASVVDSTGALLSVPYTFGIDKFKEFPRYIIYRNSLGGFQTIYTWGKAQAETDRTKEDIVKQVTYTEAARSGRARENNIRIQQKITVNTGYTSKRDILLLNDLMVSDEKFLAVQGQLIPIGISTDSLKFPEDGNNLNGAAIEIYPLYDEVVFTDDLTQPDNANTAIGAGGAPVGYNMIIDDGKNDDNIYYDNI